MSDNSDDILDVAVTSSAISRVTYDRKSQECKITMTSGGSITYKKIPDDIVESLVTAPSAGAYYNKSVRGKFS